MIEELVVSEKPEISHDQVVARVQSFYSHLRREYEFLKHLRVRHTEYDDDKVVNEALFLSCEELLDTYSVVFEDVLYPWLD